RDTLSEQVETNVGDTFSREVMIKSKDAIAERLGDDGYLFATVSPIPEVNDDNTVSITYFVTPGKLTYVRRIAIKGNTKTADEVVRREMRQIEAAPASSEKIAASKLRLERTGYFGSVDVETIPVPGTDDQVDIEYTITETQSGSFSASLGYSGEDGLLLGLSVQQDNFLGTGDKVAFSISKSDSTRTYQLSATDPYYTIDGVSRGYELYYREQDFDEDDVSSYETDEIGAGINFGYPIDENQRLNFGLTAELINVKTSTNTPQEVLDYIQDEGDEYFNFVVDLSWSDSTFNRGIFPTRGYRQSASLELGTPIGDLGYYRSSYDVRYYQPFSESEKWVGKLWSRLGYGDSLGDNEYPFFKHYFAGGIRSVRGYGANSLGPRDTPTGTNTSSDPFGGNVLITGGAELIVPTPLLEDSSNVRTSLFIDGGNVFDTSCGQTAANCDEGIQLDEVRFSTGLALSWLTPVGPLSFVLGYPLNEKAGDETRTFQFSIGQTF
ncbi:MAG: outer membrane protein assembly factor BamA, partial [Pontibacterium sp.]